MSTDTSIFLYPDIEPFAGGRLALDGLHTMHWEECGKPDGVPVLFLHGGPGGAIGPRARRFFDPDFYRAVLFDQRGAGRSTPLGETRDNTTAQLVEDIEKLRRDRGIERWLVFGGSWGATLALAYGEAYPERCLGFVLRGVFLGTQGEIDWFMNGPRRFFPEVWDRLVQQLPAAERGDLWNSLARRIAQPNGLDYARAWTAYEDACAQLIPEEEVGRALDDAFAYSIGRLESHYMTNGCFLRPNQLLEEIGRINHLPCTIVQGRYDLICPPETAYAVHRAWPGSEWVVVPDAGHAAREPGIECALVAALDRIRARLS
jgi:proline iminopeptidase